MESKRKTGDVCMPNAVQDGECVNPVKFLYQTDKKKNARSRSGHVKKVTVTSNNRIFISKI